MSNPHKAIYGMSLTGKTWLMKRIAKRLLTYKRKVLVWSGVGDLDFGKGAKTTLDVDELEYWIGQPENWGAHLMIDEGRVLFAEASSRKNYPNIHNLGTMGRHKGLTLYIATQYPTSIPPSIRINCAECYCFRLASKEQARLVYEDYGGIEHEGRRIDEAITRLPDLHALHIARSGVELIRL